MAFSTNYQRLRIAGHILFWICSFAFALWAFYVASDAQMVYTPVVFLRAIIPNLGFALAVYLNLLLLIPHFLKTKNYIYYTFWLLITLAASSTIIILLLDYTVNYEISRKLYSSYFFTAAVYVGVTSLIKFVKDWLHLQDISLRYNKVEREKLEAELSALKSQINPHFLFNCLNNIYSLSLVNSKQAPEMILKLSDLMRHVLYESRENYISLKKEVEFVKNFIELQRIRLSNKVAINFNLEGEVKNKLIIPLIFEPFIDNAFKHSSKSISEDSFINIDLKINENKLYFEVENNYEPTSIVRKDKAHGIGLKNAQKRLEYLYKKEEYKLDIIKKENIFKVVLELTLKDKL
ncbi:sensor histidine kinase [Sunxiuqinia sp. A32]|uniref:sensor histidine kinase n=1 Tax=Sunxiuqinia sp. A32 TaxID=3461496 RepID=UPI004046073E